jgi:hypothetical protein
VTSGRGEGGWSAVLETFEQHKAASAATLKLRKSIQSNARVRRRASP